MASAVLATALMAATMLPSTVPLLRLDLATARSRAHTAAVAAGYAAVWCALGASTMPLGMLMLPSSVAAIALAAAALYQVSPLSQRCLVRCRAPVARLILGRREGLGGGVRMGVDNGLWCAGCCAGLLAALVVLGATSFLGMAAFGAFAAVQKIAPFGVQASRALAAALAVAAVWVA